LEEQKKEPESSESFVPEEVEDANEESEEIQSPCRHVLYDALQDDFIDKV